MILTKILKRCQNYVVSKKSNLTHWHPVLGWFAQPMDQNLHSAMVHVKTQLYLLWNPRIISIFLGRFYLNIFLMIC